MPKRRSRFAKITGGQIALVAGALILGYVTLTSGLANAVVRANPELASQLDGSNAEALGQQAYRRMITAANQDDVRAVNELSRKALARSPMQVGALRNLGFLAEVDKRPDDAKALMVTAASISRRDALTQAWLFTYYKNTGQIAKAIEAADIAMRMSRSYRDLMTGELLKVSASDRFVQPMVQALEARPEWRLRFLQRLGDDAADPANSYKILSTLKKRNSAPSTDELTTYFARFDGSGNSDRLWAQWQYLVPAAKARTGLIRDGGFEGLDAPIPYNWTLFVAPGVYAEREACPDGCDGKVLYVSYDGNEAASFARQMLALKPGRYQLSFKVYAEGDDVSPMVAALTCSGGSTVTPLAEKPFAAKDGSWTTNRLDFEVSKDCNGQQLSFVGTKTISSATISAWLDNVTLTPVVAAKRGRNNVES
jgi:hypothetical protein